MFTKPLSICVMLAGALSILVTMIDGPSSPMHYTILACGSFLVGVGLIALALFESANKKSDS